MPARDGIITSAAQKPVVAITTVDKVGIRATINDVVTGVAIEAVHLGSARDGVILVTAKYEVIVRATVDQVGV